VMTRKDTISVGICMLILLVVTATFSLPRSPLPPAILTEEEKESPPPPPPLVQEADIMTAPPDSAALVAAEEAWKNGFQVITTVGEGEPERLIQHLVTLREGVIVVQDQQGNFLLMDRAARRKIVLSEPSGSDVGLSELSDLSMENPREIPKALTPHFRVRFEDGDTVFMVMPKSFEMTALARILKHIPADCSAAHVDLSMTGNGTLRVRLKRYEKDGREYPVNGFFSL
jgi:hypothetical protein